MGGGLQSGGFGAEGLVFGTVFVSRVARERETAMATSLSAQNSETARWKPTQRRGFLRLILQHILPKGYRRARNFGFLHPNRNCPTGATDQTCRAPPTATTPGVVIVAGCEDVRPSPLA